ncbi:MAG: TetR/AcrR family transcriptional regulator; helix-turn-helix transcriptional regulator [Bacteroidia bacterium]|nr:TetR/AcrR family transcriptional regulator; helix-turn-helix transcriptional regulator [Bacteroidia bacterium]NNJ55794.1 helix-turn-helix transcriptional regulator [Bacteroidia bacterium]
MVEIEKKTKSYFVLTKAANKLFHKYGIRKVSVEELCKEARISKMTFYRLFKNKEQLVKHILVEDFEQNFAKQKKLFDQDIPFTDIIQQSLKYKRNSAKRYSKEFVSDLYTAKDQELVKLMHDFGEKGRAFFKKFLIRSQQEGHIRKNIKIDFVMHYLEKMQEKMIDETFLNLFDNVEELSVELTNMFFYGILSNPK